MSGDHTVRSASLEARLSTVQMDIDDDDEDVLLVSIDMTNEATIPLGGLDVHIITSDGKKVESESGISSLGPGLTRNFSFEFPLEKGTWSFSVSGGGQSLSLGPYEADFTYEAEKGRAFGNAIGSSLFSGAFDANLDSFGKVAEREIIDPSSVVLTSYSGENASGGSTKISLGEAKAEPKEDKDGPRVPPWQQTSPSESPSSESPTPSGDLLLHVAQTTAATTPEPEPTPPSSAATPPPLPSAPAPEPVETPTPPSGPPSGPPSSPPTGPPAGPPSSPPSGPPSGPPSSPPTGPPTGPPSSPPTGPPAGPPTGPPSSPPTGPPSGPPTGPPAGPPSGPPTDQPPPRPTDL